MTTILATIVTIILTGVVMALAVARVRSQKHLERANKELVSSYHSFGQVLDKLSSVVDSLQPEPVSMHPDSGPVVLPHVEYSKGFYVGVKQGCIYHSVDISMPMSRWGLVRVPSNVRPVERNAIAYTHTDNSLESLIYWDPWHSDRIDEWIEKDASVFLDQLGQLEQVH